MALVCNARDCSEEFEPKAPRQKYHNAECREREQAARNEETKVERALKQAENAKHRQHLPSTFFDGTKLEAVLMDIRFELEDDKDAKNSTDEIISARVRAFASASRFGNSAEAYGALIQLAAAAAARAMRTPGHIRRPRGA